MDYVTCQTIIDKNHEEEYAFRLLEEECCVVS